MRAVVLAGGILRRLRVSYGIVSAAWVMIGAVMLRSPLFGQVSAYAGVLAGAAGIVAVVLEHISEALVKVAIPFYFGAIVSLFALAVLSGRRLWQLGST